MTTPPPTANPGLAPLRPLDRWVLRLLLILAILFGAQVVNRSAFLRLRMTDAGVFFRAAWALREGRDIYRTPDDRGWHYLYPSLFAIAMAPLADPPSGEPRDGYLPYPVSITLWTALNMALLWLASHWLASAIEESSPLTGPRGPPRFSRWWWGARVIPILFCLIAAGSTLSRGQVNILLLLSISGAALAFVRGQSARAGLWLALAAVLKVFPAFLLLYPLVRRDWRCLAGFAIGSAVGMLIIPSIVLGPSQMWALNLDWVQRVILPAFGIERLGDLADEFHGMEATDNQSFKAVLHSWLHLGEDAPPAPSPWTRLAHFALGGAFTLATLLAAGLHKGSPRPRPPRDSGERTVLTLGLLCCVSLMLTPVVHLHYFILAMPLIAALVIPRMHASPTGELPARVWLLAAAYTAINLVPRLPWFAETRHLGVATIANIALWAIGFAALRGSDPSPPAGEGGRAAAG